MDEADAGAGNAGAVGVLTRMRENQVQMAVVIDEYGGTAGIVTLQDIVSHLVGRVQDEDDEHDGNGHGPMVSSTSTA